MAGEEANDRGPEAIGIRDLQRPDYGDPVPVHPDELPVLWACGVTPQAVIASVEPECCITHAPGRMLVTDVRNAALVDTTVLSEGKRLRRLTGTFLLHQRSKHAAKYGAADLRADLAADAARDRLGERLGDALPPAAAG
jgi:hypothetical protein